MFLGIGAGWVVAGVYLLVRGGDADNLRVGSHAWDARQVGSFVAIVGVLMVIAGILT